MFTIRPGSVKPNKCHPQPKGSFSTPKTRLSLGSANETVKAIHAINPNGSNTCACVATARLSKRRVPENFCPAHTAVEKMAGRRSRVSARYAEAYPTQGSEPISKAAVFNQPHGPVKTAANVTTEPNMTNARKVSSKREVLFCLPRSVPNGRKFSARLSLGQTRRHSINRPQAELSRNVTGYNPQGQA